MALHFELVTPAKLVRSEDVHMVVVPGSEGEFGVLEGHAPFMSTIRDGEVQVYKTEGGAPETIEVRGGAGVLRGPRDEEPLREGASPGAGAGSGSSTTSSGGNGGNSGSHRSSHNQLQGGKKHMLANYEQMQKRIVLTPTTIMVLTAALDPPSDERRLGGTSEEVGGELGDELLGLPGLEDGHVAVLVADVTHRVGQELEDDALFLGVVNFLGPGGYLLG